MAEAVVTIYAMHHPLCRGSFLSPSNYFFDILSIPSLVRRTSNSWTAQNPHEKELHDVGVEEEELEPLRSLCPTLGGHSLHRTLGVVVVLGKKNVFQGAHLMNVGQLAIPSRKRTAGHHTKKRAFAKKV